MITCASKIRIHLGEKDKELNPRMIGDQKLFRTLFRAVWKFWFQRSEAILPLLIIIPIYSLVESHLFYKRNLEFGIVMGRELSKKVDISIAFFLYIHFLSSKFITPRREKKNRSESNYRSAYDFSPNNLRSSIFVSVSISLPKFNNGSAWNTGESSSKYFPPPDKTEREALDKYTQSGIDICRVNASECPVYGKRCVYGLARSR